MTQKLHLYHIPKSCTLFTRMVLNQAELGNVTYTALERSEKGFLADGKPFVEINPKGLTPTLVVDDKEMLTECLPVALYIMSLAPEKFDPFPMEEGLKKYQAISIMTFITTEMQKCVMPFYRPWYTEEVRDELRDREVRKNWNILNDMLKESNFLLGDQYTVADGYAYVVTRWLKMMNTGVDAFEFPNVKEWMRRVEQVEWVQAALKSDDAEPYF